MPTFDVSIKEQVESSKTTYETDVTDLLLKEGKNEKKPWMFSKQNCNKKEENDVFFVSN